MAIQDEKSQSSYNENELIAQSKTNIEAMEKLIAKYNGLISIKAKKLAKNPNDVADLIGEGLIGFLDAVRTFKFDGGASFKTYANTCIQNKMITSITKQNKISFNESLSEEFDDTNIKSDVKSPESIFIEQEKYSETIFKISCSLTDLEWAVFTNFLDNKSYQSIAEKLALSQKTVDNAMQRVRKKLKSVINIGNR